MLEGGGLLGRHRSPTRPGATLDAAGDNAVLVCHALTGDSPRRRCRPATGHPTPGLVGRPDRPGPAARHRPLLRRVRQRARRLPGHDRPGVDPSRRRPAVRARASRSSPSATWSAPRPRWPTTSASRRWLRSIGGSMGGMQVLEWGGDVPRPGAVARPDRHLPRRPAPSRSAGGATGRRVIRARPELARRRLLRRRARRRPARGPRHRPHGQPDHLPQRRRVHRPVRPRGRRAARRVRAVAALRGRALPRVPRRQARPPLRRQHLPAAVARRWTCTTSAAAVAASRPPFARITRAGARRSASAPTSCTRPYQQREICERAAGDRRCTAEYVEIDSPHGHDAFLIEHRPGRRRRRPSSSPRSRRTT